MIYEFAPGSQTDGGSSQINRAPLGIAFSWQSVHACTVTWYMPTAYTTNSSYSD